MQHKSILCIYKINTVQAKAIVPLAVDCGAERETCGGTRTCAMKRSTKHSTCIRDVSQKKRDRVDYSMI